MNRASKGFTLLEMLVAVGILGVLAMIARNPMRDYLRRLEFNKSTQGIKHLIQTCQSRALANPNQHIGVWFDAATGRAVPFLDKANPSAYEYDGAAADPAYLAPKVLRPGVRLQKLSGYPDEIVFRGDGSAFKSFRILVTDGTLTDTLDVLASTGRVRVGK